MSATPAATRPTSRERLLAALRSEKVDRPPAWIMRQAGRYLPEYRALREKHPFLECVRTPELATEITLQPLKRFPLDAAIVFSDILIVLEALGLRVEFGSDGPTIEPALRDADVSKLRRPEAERDFAYLASALRLCREELGGTRALLGFAGAPFTLACYAIDGGSSESFPVTRRLMLTEPARFDAFLALLADVVTDLMLLQLRSGADAVQLFDTWGGTLGREDWCARVMPHVSRIVKAVHDAGGRVILYVKDGGHLLADCIATRADAVSVDWRVDLDSASRAAAGRCALQGNLDPFALFAPREEIRRRVRRIHEQVGGRTGHVFNLGHGILPTTPIEGVTAFLEAVHELEPLA